MADYDPKDWEKHVEKTHAVIDTGGSGIPPHTLMLGVSVADQQKAYPLKTILATKLIEDHVGKTPLLVVVGPDEVSVRTFESSLSHSPITFIRTIENAPASAAGIMRDIETGSDWNFEGCAVAGKLAGQCLQTLDSNKDYWFDWFKHHPRTQVFRG